MLICSSRWRRGLCQRLGGVPRRAGERPCLWVHGASVGETLLAKGFIAAWRKAHPDWDVAVSAFTPTGVEVARKNFGDLPVFFWPLDLGFCCGRSLGRIRPAAVVLIEMEVWPGFVAAAAARGIPVAVVNGRITERSAGRYDRVPFMKKTFARISRFCAQEEQYAWRARTIGFAAERVTTTGNMKFDGLPEAPSEEAKAALAAKLGIAAGAAVLVGGSTHDPEEKLLLGAFEELRAAHPGLRLVLVPRHPERAADVVRAAAEAGHETVRKTDIDQGVAPPADAVVVVDTVGELRTLWGLATVAYVGGSLTPRGGQNIMEPAAMGKPVVFGPNMENFREARELLVGAQGCRQVKDAAELLQALQDLFRDGEAARVMGAKAQEALRDKAGATARNVVEIERVLAHRPE